jgi:hypothetical protein
MYGIQATLWWLFHLSTYQRKTHKAGGNVQVLFNVIPSQAGQGFIRLPPLTQRSSSLASLVSLFAVERDRQWCALNETLAVIASVFFFVRLIVGRFGRGVGQTHSFASYGIWVGLWGLPMCVTDALAFYT